MRTFLLKISAFGFSMILLIIAGLLTPPTPRASKSLYMSAAQKDSLLRHTPSPRMILVGGSNLSFGLNSGIIEDSLGVHPVNTAIDAGMGLNYMLDNTKRFIREGDVVVVVPEYQHYFGSTAYGSDELLRVIFDADSGTIGLLEYEQWLNIWKFIPKYSFSKLQPTEYFNYKVKDIYAVDSFNRYGDAVSHWGRERLDFEPLERLTGSFNPAVIRKLVEFREYIEAKGATLHVSYPCLQDASFGNIREEIAVVEKALKERSFSILGTPERYRMPDSLMFNTMYHLIKEGADLRTRRLIEDYREATGR